MGASYGRTQLGSTGRAIMVAASMQMDWKPGGITIDWNKVAAVTADTQLPDDLVVPNGQKFLRYGQILCKTGTSQLDTITMGGPTGGTFLLTTTIGGVAFVTPVALPYNPRAIDVETALMANPAVGVSGVRVWGPDFTGVFQVSFNKALGPVTLAVTDNTTGGAGVVVAQTTAGVAGGLWGPYDSAANDGRQSLVRGECFVLNETQTENAPLGLTVEPTNYPAVFDGGLAWKARILMSSGAHSLAAGPTIAEFEAAFPRVRYAGTM